MHARTRHRNVVLGLILHHLISKRRTVTFLIIVAMLSVAYLCFQLRSVQELGRFSVERAEPPQDSHNKPKNIPPSSKQHSLEEIRQDFRGPRIRGIRAADSHLYNSDDKGMFRCSIDGEIISYSQVNDDYCDCKDGTDEPGTSACPNSKFYCEFQPQEGSPLQIFSSRVNDGICDCCDGSDEWAAVNPPHIYAFPDKEEKKSGIDLVPCRNRCQEMTNNYQEVLGIRKQGQRLKQSYLEAGRGHEKSKYGPHGEFFRLSHNCYEYHAGEFQYTVCPFHEIKQQKNLESAMTIGRHGTWLKEGGPDGWLLEMGEGSSLLCPNAHRISQILFECGTMDKVVSIQEPERCRYHFKFTSPAAC